MVSTNRIGSRFLVASMPGLIQPGHICLVIDIYIAAQSTTGSYYCLHRKDILYSSPIRGLVRPLFWQPTLPVTKNKDRRSLILPETLLEFPTVSRRIVWLVIAIFT